MSTSVPIGSVGNGGSLREPNATVALSSAGSRGARSSATVDAAANASRTDSDKSTREAVAAALAAANRKLAADGRQVRFAWDGDAAQLIVRLVDTGTQRVLSQYPSEQALRVARLVLADRPLVRSTA